MFDQGIARRAFFGQPRLPSTSLRRPSNWVKMGDLLTICRSSPGVGGTPLIRHTRLGAMVFEQIEKLKTEYTDKYVVVDPERPELARFGGRVGCVKTVNMSGRALVEFLDMELNIGWYDIDIDFLKVVDKPKPVEKPAAKAKPAAKKAPAAKAAAAGDKKLSPLELARMQGAAKKDGSAKAGGKLSVAEMLAAARTEKKEDGTSVAEKLAAAQSKPKGDASPAAKPAGKADRSKMSVAEMIAMAKGEKSGGAAAPVKETPVEESPAEEIVEEAVAAEPEVEEAAPAEQPAAPKSAGTKVDRASMSVEDMLVFCREHDAS